MAFLLYPNNASITKNITDDAEDTSIAPAETIENDDPEQQEETARSPTPATPVPPPAIEYLDRLLNADTQVWQYWTSRQYPPAELYDPSVSVQRNADDGDFGPYFSVVRRFPDPRRDPGGQITFTITLVSSALREVCKDVMGSLSGVSWEDRVELDPKMVITFFPRLEERVNMLATAETEPEGRAHAALSYLVWYIRHDYGSTLARIATLKERDEITFDLAYAILVPGSIVLGRCPRTGEWRALRLTSSQRKISPYDGTQYYEIIGVGLEAANLPEDSSTSHQDEDQSLLGSESGSSTPRLPQSQAAAFGLRTVSYRIAEFKGVQKICALEAFPLDYDPDTASLRASLIARGRKWASYYGMHHVQYEGLAIHMDTEQGSYNAQPVKYNVTSRIVIDRKTMLRVGDDADSIPEPQALPDRPNAASLTDDDVLLASPILYGFSLSDKLWMLFNVRKVRPIVWNDEVFEKLALPAGRKELLEGLVKAHAISPAVKFDDIMRGKGQGLVINLFGPPGVGKTLSAEATSEYLRRPLYVVSSGDLGTNPAALEENLRMAFELATEWNAILLIDEADVFLQQRSLHDMNRNAMVAVFLRHMEYYRGILFLTTNRITTFDEAFLSRIHVALHFGELSVDAKFLIWRTFLQKAGVQVGEGEFTDEAVRELAARETNGRQIKNVCATAAAMARGRSEQLTHSHVVTALDAMEEFLSQFAAMRA